eukprot:scaffold3970_cov257-Pinguiococcus_pyrenoidosus.AAC.12
MREEGVGMSGGCCGRPVADECPVFCVAPRESARKRPLIRSQPGGDSCRGGAIDGVLRRGHGTKAKALPPELLVQRRDGRWTSQ